MFANNFFKLFTISVAAISVTACGGGSGGGSNNGTTNSSTALSSTSSISSSSSSTPIAINLNEIDPVKQTKPSAKFLQYSDAISLLANESIDFLKTVENGNPDGIGECSNGQGTFQVSRIRPINGTQEVKITYNTCAFWEYNAVLTGELTVKVKEWQTTMGVEGTASVNINQLSYIYNLIPMAIISGDFELAYSTGEGFATKTINAMSDISFTANNAKDLIKSLTLSHKSDYAKGNYVVELNLNAFDSQINDEFNLHTEQPLKGKTARAPFEGTIKQTGFSNNIKYTPVVDKENLTYQLSFDLGNQNNYQMLPDHRNWKEFSNLAFMWDYTSQRMYRNGLDIGLRMYPSDATMEFRGIFNYGMPGSIGSYNVLLLDQPLIIYTHNPVDTSQAKQITAADNIHVFNLIVTDSHKLELVPPQGLPEGWYKINVSITDELGVVIEETLNLQYVAK